MNANHFELLGIPTRFAVDAGVLERHYRAAQSCSHPDRHAAASAAERVAATRLTMLINEAYDVLRSPAQRARYLLDLNGCDPLGGGSGDLPPEFLMSQLEWREAMERARHSGAAGELQTIDQRLAREERAYAEQLVQLIDHDRNYADAGAVARRLCFVAKVRRDLGAMIDELDP